MRKKINPDDVDDINDEIKISKYSRDVKISEYPELCEAVYGCENNDNFVLPDNRGFKILPRITYIIMKILIWFMGLIEKVVR